MPLPRAVARFNRVGLNRLTVRFAPWAPGFGVVHHVGRRTGRPFRTPINLFRDDGSYVITLTYGTGSDWVRNVIAAGGCEIETRRRLLALTDPRLVHDESRRFLPLVPRTVVGLIGVADFLVLDPRREDTRGTRGGGATSG